MPTFDQTLEMVRDALPNVLRQRATEYPERVCYAIGGDALSFSELDRRADAVAAGAAALGVSKGDRVATLAENRLEMLELFFGLGRIGAVQVPLNAFLKGEFLRHQLAQSGASVLITDAAGREAAAPLRRELPELRTVVMLDDANGDEVPYGELSAAGDVPPEVRLGPSDTVAIVYTSGTTGLPKGCVVSHGYYCRAGELMGSALEITGDDVVFGALPLYHAGGQFFGVVMPLIFGVPSFIQRTFSASQFFPDASRVGATVMTGVGPMVAALLATEPGPADRDHRVSRFLCVPLSLSAQDGLRDRFGVEPMVDAYGQSECTPVTITPLSSDRRDPAGCGRPAPGLEVSLLDDDCRPVEDGEIGEICLRPRAPYTMFDGYYQQPEATLRAFRGLWYHTGDYGRRLPSGALSFVDRKKDALRRRGENISSIELEEAINAHPKVAESAVHAAPSALGEDDVKACVVAVPGEVLEPEELFASFKEHLPYFAVPRYVDVVEALPRNAVGRVMKHKLREAGNGPATWDLEALGLTVAREERR